METKITRDQLKRILENPARLPPEVKESVRRLLEADRETEDFLIGFASCLEIMSVPLIQAELSMDSKIPIIALIQECAISIRNRNN